MKQLVRTSLVCVFCQFFAHASSPDWHSISVSMKNHSSASVDVMVEVGLGDLNHVNQGRGVSIVEWPIAGLESSGFVRFENWVPDVDQSFISFLVRPALTSTAPESSSYTAMHLEELVGGNSGIVTCNVSGYLWRDVTCTSDSPNLSAKLVNTGTNQYDLEMDLSDGATIDAELLN